MTKTHFHSLLPRNLCASLIICQTLVFHSKSTKAWEQASHSGDVTTVCPPSPQQEAWLASVITHSGHCV